METRYITSSIPYMNGALHIGHTLEMMQTDTFARYYRLRDFNTFFLTGSDEHGSKIFQTAEKKGIPVQKMLDENVKNFQKLNKKMHVEPDDFIRTTDKKRHWPVAQDIWKKLVDNGDIYKKHFSGYYSDRHERFIPEKDLDSEKKLLEDGSETRFIEDENYFFRLSKYAPEIKKCIQENSFKIFPDFRKNEVLSFLDQEIEDISFSRSKEQLTWGVPVPNDPNHVMYVWCDALINYLSGIGYDFDSKKFNIYWPAHVHVIGKDINRFHSIYWIGILLSANISLPKNILVHGFVNDKEGKKMSKSVGNVVDPGETIDSIGADAVRIYLLWEASVGKDIDFGLDRLEDIYNTVLANNFGNVLHRIQALIHKSFPDGIDTSSIKYDEELFHSLSGDYSNYIKAMDDFDTKKSGEIISSMFNNLNQYINNKAPWTVKDEAENKNILASSFEYIYHITLLLSPFIPENLQKVDVIFQKEVYKIQEKPIIGNFSTIKSPNVAPIFPRRTK